MRDTPHLALLPQGLHDLLPPEAAQEAALVEAAMGCFASYGYQRVKPPLVEYENGGDGAFRALDPLSGRTMAVRADQTPQIARIAATRLVHAPRPLRLAYAGEVLRVVGDELRPERQFRQVGCELIGSLDAAADAEIVTLAAATLQALGVPHLSIDLTLPTLVPSLLAVTALDANERAAIELALLRRDASALAAHPAGRDLAQLVALAGPVATSLPKLEAMQLGEAAAIDRARLVATVALVRAALPDLALTIDPVERRGFEYQTGLSFTLFARGVRGEIGRGGRYRIAASNEPAVGVTLFADSLLRAVPAPMRERRAYVPAGIDATPLREQGWIAVAGLGAVDDSAAEAQRLGCTHVVAADGSIAEVQ